MFSPLCNRFGIPGVISVIALVFAMMGGAYAATNGSGGGKATASAKGKPGPRGPRGKTGPAGPIGPAGPAGAKGDNGSNGSNGSDGKEGPAGKDGTSVTSEEFGLAGKEGKCIGAGGSKFTAGVTKTFACNGKEGSPWTAGGVLPAGKTETGTLAGSIVGPVLAKEEEPVEGVTPMPITITIPLASAPEPIFVGVGEASKPGCPGISAGGTPQADAGKLCLYMSVMAGSAAFEGFFDPTGAFAPGAATTGTVSLFSTPAGTNSYVWGTWAVTA